MSDALTSYVVADMAFAKLANLVIVINFNVIHRPLLMSDALPNCAVSDTAFPNIITSL